MTAPSVRHQIRASEYEAGFSLVCTLAVCVYQEWGRWHHVGAAIAIPVAMAFSVHGINNAQGLGQWNWIYLPARVAVIVLGVAYSYQHYYHFLPDLLVGGVDLRPAVAFIMELLTLSALIAHQAHTTRLTTTDHTLAEVETLLELEIEGGSVARAEPTHGDSSASALVPGSVSLFVPPLGASSPPHLNGGGSDKPSNRIGET